MSIVNLTLSDRPDGTIAISASHSVPNSIKEELQASNASRMAATIMQVVKDFNEGVAR